MHRSFQITLPNTNANQLWTLLNLVTGAVPTDGILPDRVQELTINLDVTAAANAGATLNVGDANIANGVGYPLMAGDALTRRSTRNTICLRDYYLKGSGSELVVNVDLESM